VTSATTAEADIQNLFDYGGRVHAFFDWADPANFRVTIPEQNTGALVVDGPNTYRLWIKSSGGGLNTFNSCFGRITLTIDAIAKNSAGTFLGNFATDYRIVINR
jgi:hypothetical protein